MDSAKTKRSLRWILVLVTVVLLTGAIWVIGWRNVGRALGIGHVAVAPVDDGPEVFAIKGDLIEVPSSAAQNMKLETVVAVPRHVPVTLRLTGRTGLDMESVAHIRGQFPGRVLNIGPALGSFVHGPEDITKYGPPTTMCVVESTDLSQAKSDYVKSKVSLEVDEDAVRRTKELVDAKVLAEKFLLDAESAVKKDQADFDASRQKLLVFGLKDADMAAINQQQGKERMVYSILCPKSGIITEKNVVRGELADPTVNLFTIADLSKIWVWGDVYERDRRRVREGQQMKVIVASHPDEPRECKVEWVSPVLDSNTRSIRIRGSIDNHDGRLLADMYCSIVLQIEDPADSIILPGEAVVRKEDAAFVFIKKSTSANVTTYERRALKVEPIASGIGFETPSTTGPASLPAAGEDVKEAPKSIDGRRVRPEMVRVMTGVAPGETVVVHNALGLFQEMEDRKEESSAIPQASAKAN